MPWTNRSRPKNSRRERPDRQWSDRKIQGPRRYEDPKPGPKFPPRTILRVGFPLHHFQLRAREGVWRVGFHDGNGDGPIRTGREAHHEHSPAGHLLFCGVQQSCETSYWFGGCSFSSATRAPTTVLVGPGCLGSRRFASRKRVEQIVGPGIRHDGGSQRKNHEHARRPKADDVVPVPIPRFASQAYVE
jgi:hypothetical protein